MNGVVPGLIAGFLILVAAVVAVTSNNTWGTTQQSGAQTFAQQQITAAE